jgi:hypothetical protein
MTSALPWGHGDFITILIAIPVFFIACAIHRRPLLKGSNPDMIVGLMGSALTVGPLLMILADPFVKSFTTWQFDLLSTVVNEARVTLWLAAFIALVNTTLSFVRTRDLPVWDGVDRRKFQIPAPTP